MDATLQQRLDIFRAVPDISGDAVDLVTDELTRLDPQARLSDDQAGMFVSHAVNALTRLSRGDDTVEGPDETVYGQVLAEDPDAADAVQGLVQRAAARFGRPLPEPEIQYLTIHIAALRQHLSKENS
jgi:hypothetical protein